MRHRAVIFDLWGTLIDAIPPDKWVRIRDRMAAIVGVPCAEFSAQWDTTYLARNTGGFPSMEANIAHVCGLCGYVPTDEQLSQAAALRWEMTRAALVPRTEAPAVVRALRESGRRVGLISDCTLEVPGLWAQTPLAALIDVPVFSCSEGVKKPDPRIYLRACQRLEVRPGECLYVGDGGGRELTGAAAAGMDAVLIRMPHEEPPEPAREDARVWTGPVVRSLAEVLDHVR